MCGRLSSLDFGFDWGNLDVKFEMAVLNRPLGAMGSVTGREFDPTQAGGTIRRLSTRRIRVTEGGIDAVQRHIGRFGHDEGNRVMVDRLRGIATGEIEPTQYDLNYYSHELREFVRYRRQGFPMGAGDDYVLWNNAHTATFGGLRPERTGRQPEPESVPSGCMALPPMVTNQNDKNGDCECHVKTQG
jgi:hypothetical protein